MTCAAFYNIAGHFLKVLDHKHCSLVIACLVWHLLDICPQFLGLCSQNKITFDESSSGLSISVGPLGPGDNHGREL